MRALVIGADGFAGRWLVRHLVASGDTVAAGVGPRQNRPLEDVTGVTRVDVRKATAVDALVAQSRADVVFNLAGISSRNDREDFAAAIGVSVVGSANMLLACAKVDPRPRLLFVSTGYVYRAGRAPVTEGSRLEPTSVYAAAKLAAERALLVLGPVIGVEVVIARPLNHTGPGQRPEFVVPTIARQLLDIKAGRRERLTLADASATADFSDVRDVVTAYRLIATEGVPFEAYNVASGTATAVMDLARVLAKVADVEIPNMRSAEGVRGATMPLRADSTRLRSLGWRPRYTLAETLSDVMTDLRDSA